MRRGLAAMLAALVVPVLAGCGGDSDAPKPMSPVTSSTIVTPSESPSTTPSWESTYTPAQVRKYRAALTRWRAYERDSARIWATGKYTSSAQRIFKRYWHAPQIPERRLRQYEQSDVHIIGLERVVSQKPMVVSNVEVRTRQCVDGSQVKVTQRGHPVAKDTKKPYLRIIDLDRPKGRPWLIVEVSYPTQHGKVIPCGVAS